MPLFPALSGQTRPDSPPARSFPPPPPSAQAPPARTQIVIIQGTQVVVLETFLGRFFETQIVIIQGYLLDTIKGTFS